MGRQTASKAELQKRIRMVQEWLLNDHSYTDIMEQCMLSFKISDRQAQRYIWAARKFFQEKNLKSLESKKAYYLARKRKLLLDMDPLEKKTAAGAAAANKILDSMAKLEGITIDSTVKVIGDKDNPVHTVSQVNPLTSTIDYSKLSTEFLTMLWNSRSILNG